ncbi:hypothetical protein ACFL5G_05410 [Candidatus Margulisiibacteriota bacterium]
MTKKQATFSWQKISLWTTLILWYVLGVLALWIHNDLLYWVYGIYILAFVFLAYKNNKLSKLLYGTKIFKELFTRKLDIKKMGVFSAETNWLLMTIFPLPFLALYLDWKMFLIYTIIGILWHVLYLRKS